MSEQAIQPKPSVAVGARGVAPRSIDELYRLAEAVVQAGIAPKGDKPQTVLVKMQTGMEAGLSPMQGLQSVVVVNGRASWYGDASKAIVRSRGFLKPGTDIETRYEGEGDSYCAVVSAHRLGNAAPREERFSVAQAKAMRLWGKPGPWSATPDRMLAYRAWGFLSRDLFSDALLGLYTEAEARDLPPRPVPAEVVQAGPDPLLAQLSQPSKPVLEGVVACPDCLRVHVPGACEVVALEHTPEEIAQVDAFAPASEPDEIILDEPDETDHARMEWEARLQELASDNGMSPKDLATLAGGPVDELDAAGLEALCAKVEGL